MSRDASIVLPFAASDFTFRLAIGQWQKLEEAVDCGPVILIDRLYNGQWKVNDIRETLRWGLIGGGMKPAKAAEMVRDFIEDGNPLLPNLLIAQRVAQAGWVGAPEEEEATKKDDAVEEAAKKPSASTTSKTAKSGGAKSTGSAVPSVSIPAASTN
jgi:tail tube GTA-gp10-like protein